MKVHTKRRRKKTWGGRKQNEMTESLCSTEPTEKTERDLAGAPEGPSW